MTASAVTGPAGGRPAPAHAQIVVTSGHPTDAELAAVVAALGLHTRAKATSDRRATTSRWIRAARLEASGHPPIDSPMRLIQ